MICDVCRSPIAASRRRALPETTVCVNCSSEEPVRGVTIWPHKTGSYVQVLSSVQHARVMDSDRRGFKTAAKVETRVASGVGMVTARREPLDQFVVVNQTPSKCHPAYPRINATGWCLDCAMRLQQQRLAK